MAKPSIPKGTRDFAPLEMVRRNYIFDTIKDVFRLYGFQQIETPAMENLSTLMGKYGEEGDKLLFKILNSGDYIEALEFKTRGLNKKELKDLIDLDDEELTKSINFINRYIGTTKIDDIKEKYLSEGFSEKICNFLFYGSNGKERKDEVFRKLTAKRLRNIMKSALKQSKMSDLRVISKLTPRISEKGLRYDLTVPFARFVVMHQDKISFPFKRYQIQPVWRADRPQKGRYREFYQCDVDMVGSDSLLNEVELIQIVDEVYRRLKINVCIKINNRKILSGIAEVIGEAEKITDITVAIDKLDKIGLEKVNEELASKGIPEEAIAKLQPIILLQGSNREKLEIIRQVLSTSEIGLKGADEIAVILDYVDLLSIQTEIELDLTLARGLNYYTGAIFEVKAKDVEIGSITGGGRYDNLTGVFGLPDVSGVGISFGADRIYDVLNQLDLYPEGTNQSTKLIFVTFGEEELKYALTCLKQVRAAGIPAEIYPEAGKMKKQMGYADSKNIPFVAIVGETEMKEKKVMLKNMVSGEQGLVSVEEVITSLSPPAPSPQERG